MFGYEQKKIEKRLKLLANKKIKRTSYLRESTFCNSTYTNFSILLALILFGISPTNLLKVTSLHKIE